MSRIGKVPVTIPDGVTVAPTEGSVNVKGPKGELTLQLRPEVKIDVEATTEAGEQWLVLSAPRTVVPLKVGEHDLGSASVTADRILRWTRDDTGFFSRRRPVTEKVQVRDLPRPPGSAGLSTNAQALPLIV